MLLTDFILGIVDTSLIFYIGLKLYRVSFTMKKFMLIVLFDTTVIWVGRSLEIGFLEQTTLGIVILTLAVRYYLKKNWFASLVTILTTYIIIYMLDNLVLTSLTYFDISFINLNNTRGFQFYLVAFVMEAIHLIAAGIINYFDLHIADLRTIE